MKKSILIFCLFATLFSCKQTANKKEQTVSKIDTLSSVQSQEHFTENFKKQFSGTWQMETEFQTNTIEIKFEPGKDYATIIDIGSGEAPPFKLNAVKQDNKLIIKPFKEHNDYCELEVRNGQLIFRTQPVVWNEDGTAELPRKDRFLETVFKKVK